MNPSPKEDRGRSGNGTESGHDILQNVDRLKALLRKEEWHLSAVSHASRQEIHRAALYADDDFDDEVDRLLEESPATLVHVLRTDNDPILLANLLFDLALSDEALECATIDEAVRRHLDATDPEVRSNAHNFIARKGCMNDFSRIERYIRREKIYRVDSLSWLTFFPPEMHERCVDIINECIPEADGITVFFALQALDRLQSSRARDSIRQAGKICKDEEVQRYIAALEATWEENHPQQDEDYFASVAKKFYRKSDSTE